MPIAITRGISRAIKSCALTFLARNAIDYDLAVEQHASYVAALRDAGCEVVELPADDGLPDCCFVEDAAIVLDEVAVLGNPGTPSRLGELAVVEHALAACRPLARLEAGAHLDGGDVLRVGRKLFVGRSRRTNAAGIEGLQEALKPYGYSVTPVDVHGCLHLKTACTAVSDDTLLVNDRWIDVGPLGALRLVRVSEDEPWAANTLRLDETVYMGAGFHRAAASLQGLGFSVGFIDISELRKAEAGLTCLSILLS